ncbi:19328_t:CDS:2 [Rhizophagus irregularis]|nr:19328_t:CDS:2 [Rhizophagus irregularis]
MSFQVIMLIVASTPFSNDWRYLDDFWACQFLYAAKLQLDKEKSNSCTESTELRFPDEIVNWARLKKDHMYGVLSTYDQTWFLKREVVKVGKKIMGDYMYQMLLRVYQQVPRCLNAPFLKKPTMTVDEPILKKKMTANLSIRVFAPERSKCCNSKPKSPGAWIFRH